MALLIQDTTWPKRRRFSQKKDRANLDFLILGWVPHGVLLVEHLVGAPARWETMMTEASAVVTWVILFLNGLVSYISTHMGSSAGA